MVAFIIIVIVVIGIAVGVNAMQNTKSLAQEGKIIQREMNFHENKEVFETSASYKDICQKINETDLSGAKVSIYLDFEGGNNVFFKSADSWNAILEQCGEEEGKNKFQFFFTAWKTGRYGIVNTVSMNALITAVEKIILSIDQETTVETHKMQIKTKHKFF